MEKMFDDIIEKDEKIIKVFKPQKTRYWWGIFSNIILWVFFFGIWFILPIIGIAAEKLTAHSFDLNNSRSTTLTIFTIVGAIVVIALVLLIIFSGIAYKNRYYAYSNKRILIRSGIIGVDYRTLEFQSLTATNVRVSFLDKILSTKTGTLEFGSPSSPVSGVAANGNRFASPYSFRGIENPYDTLREIKERIDKK